MNHDIFFFPDVETTGVKSDAVVLEVGWAITDSNFEYLVPPKSHIVEHGDNWGMVWDALKNAPKVVRDMHDESGLKGEMLAHRARPFQAIAAEIEDDLSMAAAHFGRLDPVAVTMTGMSVEFDRNFLFRSDLRWQADEDHLQLGWYFHHSLLNLSSLRIAWELAGSPSISVNNPRPHRAKNDVAEGVELAKAYINDLKGIK